MRVVILTSSRYGIASRSIPKLAGHERVKLVGVILCERHSAHRNRQIRRRLLKTLRIGPLGALNGIRIRGWFSDRAEDVAAVCSRHEVPLFEFPVVNSNPARAKMRELAPDLGVSLGNGWIGPSMFSIPKQGMINFHAERLPQYQGAQSVVWPIHEMDPMTGLTIHRINEGIDTGEILYRREWPIAFGNSLRETVEWNVRRTYIAAADAVAHVCENFAALRAEAKPQRNGRTFTTPSFRQFLRIERNHRLMRRSGPSITDAGL
jgi:methionyl-tRNA formyltransferase